MITNKKGLPPSIIRAMENDSYSKGEADFSVTGLLRPPRASVLEELHKDEIIEDASNKVWALLGQSVHSVLERSRRPGVDIVERRFFGKFGDFTISGAIDLYELDTGVLSDFKVTKAYAFSTKGGSGQKIEWVMQMNMQLELMRMNGFDANKLQIVGILRDFEERKALNESGYPPAEIVTVELPIWPREVIYTFIVNRIRLHTEAKSLLPLCTKAETWNGLRCRRYCVASPFCEQYKQTLKTGIFLEDE